MSNTLLTSSIILKECYAIMHQSSNFIARTNRQYDSRFANKGAQIGQQLDIRLPPKYTTRTGNTMSSQNVVDRKVTLPLATINGVDLLLTQEDLTFKIEELSQRVLQPAVSQLAASTEGTALTTLYKQVANYAGTLTTTTDYVNYQKFQDSGRYISEQLAPPSPRTMTMNPQTRVDFSTDVKGLFQSSSAIEKQYVDGMMGRTGGYDVFENTLMPSHTPGTFNGTLSTTVSTTADSGYAGTGNAYTTSFGLKFDVTTSYAFKAGDIITIGSVYDVQPETKTQYGTLKRFTVVADTSGTTTGTLTISPAPILAGAYQNVNTAIADNAAITVVGSVSGSGTAGIQTYGQNLGFHRDAFAFVTADLEDPTPYGAWGAREVFDGLSMRIWRQGDISNGTFPCRLDIAWGCVAVYPEWAVRLVHSLR
jgi:hypothetical protein